MSDKKKSCHYVQLAGRVERERVCVVYYMHLCIGCYSPGIYMCGGVKINVWGKQYNEKRIDINCLAHQSIRKPLKT